MNIPEHTRTTSAFSVGLAIGKYKFTCHNCNQKAKELFDQYCEHFEVNPQGFEGVELTDFPQLEKYYETRLFAMFLKEDGTAKTLYLSQSSFPTKIYVNVYEHHLSLITDIQMYSKQYICNRCDKVFTKMSNHMRHQSKCDGTVEYAYPGGVYKNKLSVFEELEKMGVVVHEEDKYEKWFPCYDFEAYQRDFREGIDQVEEFDSEKVRLGIRRMFQCRLVWGVIWKAWKPYMSWLVRCLKWLIKSTGLLLNDLNIYLSKQMI